MQSLRTVSVLEHEVIPVLESNAEQRAAANSQAWLSALQAKALLQLNDQRPGFCQWVAGGIKLAQHCGLVLLPGCIVEVLPKVGFAEARSHNQLKDEQNHARDALLTMLQSARQLAISKVGRVPQDAVHAPLLDLFIEAFLHCALKQAKRGLLGRYRADTDDLPVIKGSFLAHTHIRRNLARPHLLHCQYDEFTPDNAYNRAVRATLEVCRPWIGKASTERLWFETQARFASVSSVRMLAADVAQLPRNRTTRRYEELLVWCEWLLGMVSPALRAGAAQAPGLLFDMNQLFEAHVTRREQLAAGNQRIVCTQGPQEYLAKRVAENVFLLKPDITVWHIGTDGNASTIDRVVDAKWKRLDLEKTDFGIAGADIYQLLAYALRYDCTTLELAYPLPYGMAANHAAPAFQIQASSEKTITVKVKLVPLC